MKIAGLTDWLAFVDEVVAPAERLLRDVGVPEGDWSALITSRDPAAEQDERLKDLEELDLARQALKALRLRREIHRAARHVSYRPDRTAACLSAMAWKLQKAMADLPSSLYGVGADVPADSQPGALPMRGVGAILSGDYGVQTKQELLDLLSAQRLELREQEIDVWRDELARKVIFLDVATEEMDVIDESAVDEVVSRAQRVAQG